MQAVVLAAGDGDRLLPLTEHHPKSLLEVGGRPLIERVFDTLLLAGARELIVVLGYRGDQIAERLDRWDAAAIRYVWNRDTESGSARSLLAALPMLDGGPFLLSMADHLFADGIGAVARGVASDKDCVFVDRRPMSDVEATRVCVASSGTVTAIGKGLQEWNAIDAGMFLLHPQSLTHLEDLPPTAELNDAWQPMIARRQLHAVDIGETWWTDIDTAADLAAAEATVRQRLANVV